MWPSRVWHWMKWQWGLSEEVKYWSHWFDTKGDEWPEDYAKKINPKSEFELHLRKYFHGSPNQEIQILDVGAGPMTGVGYVWPGRRIKITAVDPLAKTYAKIMTEHGVTPPIRTEFCPAETLTKRFKNRRFDLVHCRNALDHSYNPMEGIKQMLAVTKPGGTVVLDHYTNEAVALSYQGLHQWNFDVQDGRFVLWSRLCKIDVAEELKDIATVEFETYKLGRVWVRASITKRELH